ncbi:hypothetical protein MUP77_15195 [Candidatus Bathyarchaeota archaeon]|nr:hypothetical protein [Candidatus Bathyarchaeota archaeon]
MENGELKKPAIECSMSYTLFDAEGKETATGECKGAVDEESLTVLPDFGNILPVQLREILDVNAHGYRITLPLASKEKLVLFNLGYCYEDFLRVLSNLRNEMTIKDMLMNETVKKSDVSLEFIYFDDAKTERLRGEGKIRLYETGLVVIPQKDQVVRIPYSDISSVSKEDLSIRISTEFGEQWFLSKLAQEHDPLIKTLTDVLNELQQRTVASLRELLPDTDSISIRRVAGLMRDGKAAKRVDIEAMNPKVWRDLENKITLSGSNETYIFLKDLARQERISIGVKRGLIGDLTGEYLWFLLPIYSLDAREPGNAVAMEAAKLTEDETGGKATYFFRITDRSNYANYMNIEELDLEADQFIRRINRCMLDINFRREPIYLQDEKLDDPTYFKYKVALLRIPSLRYLRNLYIGRIIHTSPEQWKSDVKELLKFNVEAQDNSSKWKNNE